MARKEATLRRYLLFSGTDIYTRAGWLDFVDDFDTIKEANKRLSHMEHFWFQIVDSYTKTIIDGRII